MDYTLITHLIYLAISITITMFVGYTLFKNGRLFLIDIFRQNERLADSVNKLLLTGFYLLNIGYITLKMNNGAEVINAAHMVEKLSYKIGLLLLVLGVIHFTNLFVLYRMRKRVQDDEAIHEARMAH